ncbi:MAG: DUF192 domain-containing protein [Pseudomonadota bacterium]
MPRLSLSLALPALLCCAMDAESASAQFAQSQVVLLASAGEVTVKVELARTPQEMARGLMYRRQLDADDGMLFLYSEDGNHSFWMKNTYIPLDMIFIGSDRRVVGVVENAEPLTTVSRQVGQPSRYVLEVNAGFSRRHGVAAGTAVRFVGIAEAGPTGP